MASWTYFDALGLTQFCTQADVKAAYRKLAAGLHPDVSPADAEKFKLLSAAYHELSGDKLPRFQQGLVFGRDQRQLDSWSRDWEAIAGPKFAASARPRSGRAGFMASDIEDMIRETERLRREARRQREDEEWSREQARWNAREARRRAAEEAADAHDRAQRAKASEPDAGSSSFWAEDPKPGKCNAHTASGPCCRPAGHTPNGHMSQKVADQKRENQRMRKARGY